jgi:hypothetical protein
MMKDDDYIDLPEDEELAFLQIEKECRALLNKRIDEARDDSPFLEYYQDYINSTLAGAHGLQIDHFSKWETPTFKQNIASTHDQVYDTYRAFSLAVAEYTMQVRIRHSRRAKRYSVAIDSATKSKIRHHLTQLKELTEKLEIPIAKREAIYAKIVALEMEMERERTRFEVIAALVLETASVVGQAGEKLEPWRKWIDSIASLFGHAKDKDTQHPSLPLPEDRKRLDPPKRDLPSPPPDDSEIPFPRV